MTEHMVAGYEFTVKCPNCGYRTDASRGRYYDDDGNLICGADGWGENNNGCGAALKVTVTVVEEP